jgi:hypothetical protein
MTLGRVYVWENGRVRSANVQLPRLNPQPDGRGGLSGRFVRVRNGGAVNVPDPATGEIRPVPFGDARPNNDGDFLFEPGRGGGRMDKVTLADPDFRDRYLEAAHFGEVNTYYHLDRIATYVNDLLQQLGASSLPPVTAVVNAHHAATVNGHGRDGVRRGDRWVPFQGGHYRLPSRRYDVAEHEPIHPDGEIHLGPGRTLLDCGALVEAAGGRYRANASHNAGILYHEYGHHVARHTADFRGNAMRRPHRQNNRKPAIEEGTCDYWAAAMLGTPHIWVWHRRHDHQVIHPRSLGSSKTMADFAQGPKADPHANGTIWGAALWDLRDQLGARCDLLVLQALLLIGERPAADIKNARRARASFQGGLAALLAADERLHGGRHGVTIAECFGRRGLRMTREIPEPMPPP